jgi:serine phosphatase RsbU (regulator of sigma subunit)
VGFQPSRFVAGDYVDVVQLADGRVLLAIADASDLGLPAALTALRLHSMVHTALYADMPLADMMQSLNEQLLQFLPESSFVTMAALIVDPASGAVACANAGHQPPLIFRPDGEWREVQVADNFPLGIAPMQIVIAQAELAEDELLALVTDGLTQVDDGEGHPLGSQGLAIHMSQLCQTKGRPEPADIARRLEQMLDAFAADQAQRDDRTYLLAARR